MNNKKSKKTIILSVLVLPVFFSGIFAGISPCKEKRPAAVTLEFWSVYDDSDFYSELLRDFNKEYPYITVNFHKKNFSGYEQELIDALAAGRGPDIFSIQNSWLPKHQNKLYPAPLEMITPERFQQIFVDVAAADFVGEAKISDTEKDKFVYAFPFFVDSLALFYNRDLLNNAGVAEAPKTWEEFNSAVEKITRRDVQNNILLSGAALGTAKNVNRASDVLSLLMLQNGTKMVADQKNEATFSQSNLIKDNRSFSPGENAVLFYTSFGNTQKKVYSWNQGLHYSIDAFVEGNAAMMINYAYQISVLRSRAPHLNFATAPVPQISSDQTAISFANYWGQAVSKDSKNSAAAWQFLAWMIKPENLKKYLEASGKPSSRRDLLSWQKSANPELAVFNQQALTSKSWYQIDNVAIENIFAELIDTVVLRQATAQEAIDRANKQVTLLMRGKNN